MLPWSTYNETIKTAAEDRDGFWSEAAQAIDWYREADEICRPRPDGWYEWFAGGMLNTCYNAVDRHVLAGYGDQNALIWYGSVTKETRFLTYKALQKRVSGFSGGLLALGIHKGDRVLISMPSLPEAIIAMLACARLGAIHVVVFGGHAPRELAVRINDTTPKIIITASCGFQGQTVVPYMPQIEEALQLSSHKPDACIILQRQAHLAAMKPGRDHDFYTVEAHSPAPPVPLRSEDPLYILHTSGTTGSPKGIVRDNGGHAVALCLSMKLIYGMKAGDVFFTTSDIGWVVGHSYAVYAPLLAGCTAMLAEGPIDARAVIPLCQHHNAKCLFTTPTLLRLLRRQSRDTNQSDTPSLRTVFVAGEYSDPTLLTWASKKFSCPVLNHWWQTETGWGITAHHMAFESDGSPQHEIGRASPGFTIRIKRENSNSGSAGEIQIQLPLPPGCLSGLWKDGTIQAPKSYLDSSGNYYRTFDRGHIRGERLILSGRSDDVIKIAGRRIASTQIEGVIASHADVFACAVISAPHALKGEKPVAYVIPANQTPSSTLAADLVQYVRQQMGTLVSLKDVHIVDQLPMTLSGKIKRKQMALSAESKN